MSQPHFLSLGEAAKLTGLAKSTLSRAIKNGALSATRDGPDTPYKINVAELERVYPLLPAGGSATGGATPESNTSQPHETPRATPENVSQDSALKREIELLREMLDGKNDEIQDLRKRLDNESEERRKLTLMITHQKPPEGQGAESGRTGWWRRLTGR